MVIIPFEFMALAVEPGRVGNLAVRVVVVWALSIAVSAWLTETIFFMDKLLMYATVLF